MVNSTLVSTIYVNSVQGNDANAGSRLSPFKSLTRALKASTKFTIIQLSPGTYSTATGEAFPLIIPVGVIVVGNEANKGAGIVIIGSGTYQSPSFGTQNITLLLQEDASLRGVTVTNTTSKGTGVWIESTAPNVSNNTFINCAREGIFTTGSAKPAILDNVFLQNAASGLTMARNSKGEVLRNIFQKNTLGIAISDFAAPLIANNKLTENQTAIALSRDAKPVLRQNTITNNTQGGLLVNGNAIPDLGSTQDAAGNIFHNNQGFDLQNVTALQLVSVGNQLNPIQVKGAVDFLSATVEVPSQVSVGTSFYDLGGHWAVAFVEALVGKGLISGFPDSSFKPNAPITRAQYAAIIAKTFPPPNGSKVSNFTDIKSDYWAASAILRAANMGFVSGFPDGTFRPEQNLTKIQAIVSIVNGLQWSGGNSNVLSVYRDRAQIPSYATNAVAVATQKLLVVNYPTTEQLEPLKDISRAEVAALIYQALVAIGQEKAIASPYIVNPEINIPSFSDLKGHWAEEFIRGLVSMGLSSGFADGSYQPDKPMTRAQYASLVATAFNPTAKRPAIEFTDIAKDFWAAKAIQTAAMGGFVGGFSDRTFRPDQNVQRLQVIVSLVNGLGLPAADIDNLLAYSDRNTIPEYARQAVATATQQQIVVNYPNSQQLVPVREATRAEVAAMVYQALVAIQRTKAINSPYIVSHASN
ncbi:S-layer homology domain-containing protein [Calothrix sp. FACHB-1219]|uniref:S-layer homology domain-containing protein n=1 Tax=unclassified Calothrix TaxID=2619626 RepID=UPI001685AB29|nr:MULTISPECIES: S-layer homology domain-containing protein [unclassified Calothrix]MBD2202120.1 S-layer homology domain-containing protein [Calothrix sp. FACHB-168]MBD2217154.1 S-layer homology domain-containing protein [Calothrix sp. FACHB-1219]